MDKKRFLSSMAVVGYGLVAVFVVLAIAIGIMIGVNGLGKPEKKVNNLVISMPENTEGVTTNNNVTSISTEDIFKSIDFKVAGLESGDSAVDYSTRTITVVINNSSTEFTPAKKEETSVWFAQKDEKGQILLDENGNYIPVESNRLNVKVNDTVTLIMAITQYPDDPLNPNPDEFYLKGGISHIHARSGDLLLQAQELKVQVDVPVVNFDIVVKGYDYNDVSGQKVDLTESVNKTAGILYEGIKRVKEESDEFLNLSDTTKNYLGRTMFYVGEGSAKYRTGKYYTVVQKENNTIGWEENNSLRYFIKGTELELGVKTFPSNATTAVLGSFKKAVFTLNTTNSDSAMIEEGTNILKVVGADDETTGSVTVTATLPKLLDGYARVEKEIVIETAKYEIENFEITNGEQYWDADLNQYVVDCLLNKPVSISFNGNTSDFDVGLGINLIPRFYNGHDNPYKNDFTSLYAELKTNHDAFEKDGINPLDSIAVGLVNPLQVVGMSEQNDGGKVVNKIATISANRLLYKGEEVLLYISDQTSFSDVDRPFRVITLNPIINKPETNHQNPELNELVCDTELSVDVAKQDKDYIEKTGSTDVGVSVGDDVIIEPGVLSIDRELKIEYLKETEKPIIYPTQNQSLFYTWVYFAEKKIAATDGETPPADFNSDIILLSSKGQVKTPTTFGTQVYAVGNGNIALTPKLVLCDSEGNPLNCFYQPFTVTDATGFLMRDDIEPKDLTTENQNNYVVIFDPEIRVNVEVNESLINLAFFYDVQEGEVCDIVQGIAEVASSTYGDGKTFYIIGNSKKALKNSQGNLDAWLVRGDETRNKINIVSSTDYSSFTVSDTRADDACHVEFKIKGQDSPIADLSTPIKAVDIQSIDAFFDVVNELTQNQKTLRRDVGRRVYYNGANTTITSLGTDLDVERGKFYIVKSQDVDGVEQYYWDEDEKDALSYNAGVKSVVLTEGVETSGEIWFKLCEGLDFPKNVYYNLTIKRDHGYENLDISGSKTIGYKVLAIPTSSPQNINVSNFAGMLSQYEIKKIMVRELDNKLKFFFLEGWETDVAGKNIYLVYTMHIGQTLKALDSYKLDVDLIQSDLSMTLKTTTQVGVENYNLSTYRVVIPTDKVKTTNMVSMVFASSNDPTVTQEENLADIRDWIDITNNKTSTNYGFMPAGGSENMSGEVLKAILVTVDNGNYTDRTNYVTVSISDTGLITLNTAELDDEFQELVFTTGDQENPLTKNFTYKLIIYGFDDVEGNCVSLAVEIPLKLEFNVGYQNKPSA